MNIGFALRDYLIHLFPGSIALFSLAVLYLEPEEIFDLDYQIIFIIILIVGYVVGIINESITTIVLEYKKLEKLRCATKWAAEKLSCAESTKAGDSILRGIDLLTKDPIPESIIDKKEALEHRKACNAEEKDRKIKINSNEVSYALRCEVENELNNRHGRDFIENEKLSSLIYFLIRVLDLKNPASAASCVRIQSLENLTKNLVIPLVLSSIVAIKFELNAYAVAVPFVVAILLWRRGRYRVWLAETAMRGYLATVTYDAELRCKDDLSL